MMQVTVQPSSLANYCKNNSNVEERKTSAVSVPQCTCLVRYAGRNSSFTDSRLGSGCGAVMVVFVTALCESRVYHWLKGEQNLTRLGGCVFGKL